MSNYFIFKNNRFLNLITITSRVLSKNIFPFVMLIISIYPLCTDPLETDEYIYYYRDESQYSYRDLPVYTPPCSCNCQDIIKSGYYYSYQTDDDVMLHGSWYYQEEDLHCQKIVLNISACKGYPITDISISFDTNEDDCFDENFHLYRDNNGELIECPPIDDGFDPRTESGHLCLSDDPIPACSSRKVAFYICTSNMISYCDFTIVDVQLTPGLYCYRNMIFHFDGIVGELVSSSNNSQDNIMKLKLSDIEMVPKLSYKLINILNTTIKSWYAKTKKEVRNELLNSNISPGLYILQIYENEKLIHKEKIFLSY